MLRRPMYDGDTVYFGPRSGRHTATYGVRIWSSRRCTSEYNRTRVASDSLRPRCGT